MSMKSAIINLAAIPSRIPETTEILYVFTYIVGRMLLYLKYSSYPK